MRALLFTTCLLLPFSVSAGDYAAEFDASKAAEARGDLKEAEAAMLRSYESSLAAGDSNYATAAATTACHLVYQQGNSIEAGHLARKMIGMLHPLPSYGNPAGEAVRRVQLFGFMERGLMAEGKLGSAWQANRAAAETLRQKKVTADADGPPITVAEVIAMRPALRSYGWRVLERESELLDLAGRAVEARTLMDEAAIYIGSKWHDLPRVEHFYAFKLLSSRAMTLDFLGYEREALAAQQELFELSEGEKEISNPRLTLHLNILRNRSQWEGPSEEILAQAREVGAALKKNATERGTDRLLAKMELDLKESKEALDILRKDAERDASTGRKFDAVYSGRDSLLARARNGEGGLDAEFSALLFKMRAQGNKRGEPNLYREYGDYLLERKRPAEAIATFTEALRLIRSFGWTLHEAAVLYDLFKARFEAGDIEGARATLAEIEAFLRAHPELPDSRRVPAEVSRALALAKLGDKEGARAAFALARSLAGELPDYKKRWLQPEVESRVITEAPPSATPGAPVANFRLQPLEVSSLAIPGESARTRFSAFNPGATGTRGHLVFRGPGAAAERGGNLIQFRADQPLVELKLPRTVSGGGETRIEVAMKAAGKIKTASVEVSWENDAGATGASSKWDVNWTPGANRSVVLDASLLEANPFRSVSLSHEVSFPGREIDPVPFRLTSPVALRFEYYDPRSEELIAVDANGNGDFTEAGDLHLIGRDGVAGAMLPRTAGEGRSVIEIRIFASTGEPLPLASPALKLRSEVYRDGKWTAEAENILR